MNNQQDNLNSNNGTAMAHGVSVGNRLREAREQLGLSVNDVANRIKFAPKQIEWLEADDYHHLPEAAFVRGFVRSYARLVELEPSSLLSSLPSSHVQPTAVPEVKSVEVVMPTALSARRHNIIWLAAALLVALSLAIFQRMQDRSPEKAVSVADTTTTIQTLELPNSGAEALPSDGQAKPSETAGQPPVRTPPVPVAAPTPAPKLPVVQQMARTVPVAAPVVPAPKPAPATQQSEAPKDAHSTSIPLPWQMIPQQSARTEPSQPDAKATTAITTAKPSAELQAKPIAGTGATADHALRLEFDEDSWVEIKDGDDKVLISRMHTAGSLVRVAGKSPLDVTIGNAHAVRLFDNGKSINLVRYTTADVARIKLK